MTTRTDAPARTHANPSSATPPERVPSEVSENPLATVREALQTSAPCRYCGRPAWQSDDDGPLHACCQFWIGHEGKTNCVACAASAALWNQHDRRQRAARTA